jgi:hypothetical protein
MEAIPMNSEISRRGFLSLAGAAFARKPGETENDVVPWWADCSTSPHHRPLARATAEGFVVSLSDAGAYSLGFIDDDFPTSAPLRLWAGVRHDLQIVGTARYEMSFVAWGVGIGSDLAVTFQDPADITVYTDESKHGGTVIIVALERCGERNPRPPDDSAASRRAR